MQPQQNRFIDQLPILLALGILLGGCAIIILPFGSTLLWAGILTFTTRHVYWWLCARLGNRPWLASTLLVTTIITLVIVPSIYGLVKISVLINDHATKLTAYFAQNTTLVLPDWLAHIPYAGETISAWWDKLVNGDPDVKQQVSDALKWVASILLRIATITGQGFGLLFLSCIFSLFFYVSLDNIAAWLNGVMTRLSPNRGAEIIDIVGKNIQAVVIGIAGTAAVQGMLAGIGYMIAGVPNAITLGLASIILSLLPFGHAFLWIPVAFGFYHSGETGWAIFMLVWGAGVVGSADNFVKPLLIGKGSKLPLLLIVIGMIGGALNFGVLGVFIGPTLLAVAYTLLREWALENKKV